MDFLTNVGSLVFRFLQSEFQTNPLRTFFDGLLIILVIYVVFQSSYKIKKKPQYSEKDIQEILSEWKPEPLVPESQVVEEIPIPIVSSAGAKYITVNGKDNVLNLASFNFLGLSKHKTILDEAAKSVRKYGVGSCGPRGFYGTIDVHLNLEKKLSEMMGTQDSILYSLGFATVSSVIQAFSKVDDLIVCDEGVSFAVQTGIGLSRTKCITFKHNDVEDLENVLKKIKEKDGNEPVKQRRFLIVEGLYQNFGDVCPLDKIVALKNKYCYRLLLDDSFGFGTLGKKGRGVIDLFNVSMDEIDFYVANLENSIASIGGFCTGNSSIVDHQRLAGKGYCFSASSPPYISTAAIEALKIIETQPELINQLESRVDFFAKQLGDVSDKFLISSTKGSPIFHIRLVDTSLDRQKADIILQKVVDGLLDRQIAVARSKYIGTELVIPPPSVRMTITVEHTEDELKKAAQTIKDVLKNL